LKAHSLENNIFVILRKGLAQHDFDKFSIPLYINTNPFV